MTNLSIPEFCTTEITDDYRFANESLSHDPYDLWANGYARELADRGPRFMETFGTNTLGQHGL